MDLQTAWQARLKFEAKADKLEAESDRLSARGSKLRSNSDQMSANYSAESVKLLAESEILEAESNKLLAEGNKIWAEAILEAHGNIKVHWRSRSVVLDCHLETGEIFRGDEPIMQGSCDQA